jgi:hypothetical protein
MDVHFFLNSNNAFYVVRILYLVIFRVLSSGQAALYNSACAVSFIINYLKFACKLDLHVLFFIYLKTYPIT